MQQPFALSDIEIQLKKRWAYPYRWCRKQNDLWDGFTRYIYTILDWEQLVQTIARTVAEYKLDKRECFYYAINRWYNFWSATAVEHIFCEQPGVRSAPNAKDKQVDFYLHDIPFDHKTSVFPKGYGKSFSHAKQHPSELLYWLYAHQSKQGRKHHANRLFLVTYRPDGQHWKVKAEISILQAAIRKYVATFDPQQLTTLQFGSTQSARSDIVWVESSPANEK